MNFELLLLRHAKSDWYSGIDNDFDRPINPRGRDAAQRIGRWLKTHHLIPDYIISSPALRAEQTVQRILPEIGVPLASVHWNRRIYEANVAALMNVLNACPSTAQRVLLVGHNPGLEQLLVYLSGERPVTDDGKLVPTATLVQLALADNKHWAELENNGCRLLGIHRPKQLPPVTDRQ